MRYTEFRSNYQFYFIKVKNIKSTVPFELVYQIFAFIYRTFHSIL